MDSIVANVKRSTLRYLMCKGVSKGAMIVESKNKLPSNRRFGVFFASIFLMATLYCLIHESSKLAWLFAALFLLLSIVTVTEPDVLSPLNKLWMRLGLGLGTVVSPIVLGVIFFGLFTPIGVITRLSGRDELRFRLQCRSSHWITRDSTVKPESFRQQF